MKILVKKLRPGAVLPTAGSRFSAGYDLYACLDAPLEIPPHTTAMVGTGLSMAVPEGWFGAVFARSGLATKQGLRPSNCVGVCDSDYRGEVCVSLHNHGTEPAVVAPHERIAQLVIVPVLTPAFEIAESLTSTERGTGGFGSTGTK